MTLPRRTLRTRSLWEQGFLVAPLVLVGTRDADGSPNFAPKHMAMPLSWQNHFGFVCTEKHATYQNIQRDQCFTVSVPTPDQILAASLAAGPRCDDQQKFSLKALATTPASKVNAELLRDAQWHFECELDRIIDDFAENSLICGRIIAGSILRNASREFDRDDHDLIAAAPLLAYLHPGRFATIRESHAFPYHEGTSR